MTFYSAPFTFDFESSLILVDSGAVVLACADIYTACKLAQGHIEGITYPRIAIGSGLNTLSPGVQVGLTVELLDQWQIKFPDGSYVARIGGGNLIGGPLGDPLAYSPGVQSLLIQAASSTVVQSTEIDAIKAKTDQLTFNGGALDANTKRVNGYLVTGAGTAGSPWGPA